MAETAALSNSTQAPLTRVPWTGLRSLRRFRTYRWRPRRARDLRSRCLRRLRPRLHFAAVGEIHGRIEDHLVARLDPAVDADALPEVARHLDLSQMDHAILHHRDLQAGFIENDRVGGNRDARRLARNVKLDGAVDAGGERAVRIWDVDLGQKRSRSRLQGLRDPRDLAGKAAVRNFWNVHHGLDPGLQPERLVLRNKHLRPDDVALHDREHEGAAGRIGLDQAADVDIALGDDALERRHHALIGLLLLQDLQLGLFGDHIGLRDGD